MYNICINVLLMNVFVQYQCRCDLGFLDQIISYFMVAAIVSIVSKDN